MMKISEREPLPLVLSVEQLAVVLQVGRNTAYELVRSGSIKSIRVGHQIRVPKKAIQSFLGEN